MLSNTAPVQGLMVLLAGPYLDSLITQKWILTYLKAQDTYNSLYLVLLSCLIASATNISQFMCLGRFSAVTFQVLGHTKTIMVLLLGWLLLGDVITVRKLAGMSLAVIGMIAYSVAIPSSTPKTNDSKKT
jgi:solute carrier family 35 protein E3